MRCRGHCFCQLYIHTLLYSFICISWHGRSLTALQSTENVWPKIGSFNTCVTSANFGELLSLSFPLHSTVTKKLFEEKFVGCSLPRLRCQQDCQTPVDSIRKQKLTTCVTLFETFL